MHVGLDAAPRSAQRAIDWSAPWLAPLADAGAAATAQWASSAALHHALNVAMAAQGRCPVSFVAQDALGPRMPYEMHVAMHDQVPTRDNLHDLFNALVWGVWPQLKLAFNRLHAQALAGDGGEARRRGPVRDALTLWDENGAVLIAPPALWAALRAHDWPRLFGPLRPLWAHSRLWLVGHALMEQLLSPRKGLTAHVWLIPEAENAHALQLLGDQGEAAAQAWVDARVGQQLRAIDLCPKPFTPLPVLGVPGWWSANEAPGFYDDPAVFRPLRKEPPEPVRWLSAP